MPDGTKLMGIILLAIVLHSFTEEWSRHDEYGKKKDAYEYSMIGASLSNNEGILFRSIPDVILPPGYPLAIVLVTRFLTNPELRGRIVSLIALLLSGLIFYKIASSIFPDVLDRTIGLVLFMGHSQLIINGVSGRSEALFLAVSLLLCFIVIRSIGCPIGIGKCIAMGILLAYLYLIRPEGILFFIPVMLARHRNARSRFVIVCVVVFLTLPYIFFLKEQTGRWQSSGKAYPNLVMGELESPYQLGELKASSRYRIIPKIHADPTMARSVMDYVREAQTDFSSRIIQNAMNLLREYIFTISPVGILLALIGVTYLRRDTRLIISSFWAVGLMSILFFILARHLPIYHPYVCIMIVAGIREISRRLVQSSRIGRNFLQLGLCLVLILFQLRSTLLSTWFN